MKIVVKGNIGYVKVEIPDATEQDSFYSLTYVDGSNPNHRYKKLIEVIESICKEVKGIDNNSTQNP